MERGPNNEEIIQQRKWERYIPPRPKSDWPSIEDVESRFPELCQEEHGWILENEIYQKLNEKRENETN